MEYDIATGSNHRKGEIDADNDGIAWVSGKGGTRGLAEHTFLLEVAGVTPGESGGPPHTDWLFV